MPTLEERVAALEAQMATIENTKYEMSYSGESLEATLDFVNERNLRSGRELATLVSSQSGTNVYRAGLDFGPSAFEKVPTYDFDLIYSRNGNEYIVSTTSKYWMITSEKYQLWAITATSIPSDAVVMISYNFFEKTT